MSMFFPKIHAWVSEKLTACNNSHKAQGPNQISFRKGDRIVEIDDQGLILWKGKTTDGSWGFFHRMCLPILALKLFTKSIRYSVLRENPTVVPGGVCPLLFSMHFSNEEHIFLRAS